MNPKIKTEIALGIILTVVIIIGGAVWFGGNRKQAEQPAAPIQVQADNQKNQGAVYTNSEFGFQITLPKGWEDYRITVDKRDVYVSLPTTDKDWVGIDPANGTTMTRGGFARIISISIWSILEWDKHLENCKKLELEQGIEAYCRGEDFVMGKGNIFVYEIISPQDLPEDLRAMYDPNVYINEIKNSFKMIPLPDLIGGWKTYRNEKLGFEFQYPGECRDPFWSDDIWGDDRINFDCYEIIANLSNILVSDIMKRKTNADRSLHEFYDSGVDRYDSLIDLQKNPGKYKEYFLQKTLRGNERIDISGKYKIKIDSFLALDVRDVGYGGCERIVYILKDDLIFEISLLNYCGVGSGKHEPTFDKILSTFKFTK